MTIKKALPRVEHVTASQCESLKVKSVMTLEADQLTGHRSAGSLRAAM